MRLRTYPKTRKPNKYVEVGAVISSVKRQNEYQGYRTGTPDRPATNQSMPILIGAAMIAAAILLVDTGHRDGHPLFRLRRPDRRERLADRPSDGSVYRCEAPVRGKASCEAEIAVGSPGKPNHRLRGSAEPTKAVRPARRRSGGGVLNRRDRALDCCVAAKKMSVCRKRLPWKIRNPLVGMMLALFSIARFK